MATFKKAKFTESLNGRGIKIVNTSTPGNTIHQAVGGTEDFHEIWLYAYNHDVASVDVTIEYGGVTAPDDLIKQSVPSQSGLYLIIPGYPLQGGMEVKVYASKQNVIMIHGFVNSIDQA